MRPLFLLSLAARAGPPSPRNRAICLLARSAWLSRSVLPQQDDAACRDERAPEDVMRPDNPRRTCALLLNANVPIHVVSERLGHKNVSMTMEIYAHVLPDMQEDAAATLGRLLYER
jgi:integrase